MYNNHYSHYSSTNKWADNFYITPTSYKTNSTLTIFLKIFNESKHVSFSMFAIELIWLTLISTYFTNEHKSCTAIMTFALSQSGFVALLIMFGPRIFIIIFLQERNTFFTIHPRNERSVSLDFKNLDTSYGPSTTGLMFILVN